VTLTVHGVGCSPADPTYPFDKIYVLNYPCMASCASSCLLTHLLQPGSWLSKLESKGDLQLLPVQIKLHVLLSYVEYSQSQPSCSKQPQTSDE
jgi:hypothetical protein